MIKIRHESEEFVDETFVLSDHEFVGCEFLRCRFIYRGEPVSELQMVGCQITDCQYGFEGAAAQMMLFLSSLYNQSPKMDDALKLMVEHMFIGVRTGHIFRNSST